MPDSSRSRAYLNVVTGIMLATYLVSCSSCKKPARQQDVDQVPPPEDPGTTKSNTQEEVHADGFQVKLSTAYPGWNKNKSAEATDRATPGISCVNQKPDGQTKSPKLPPFNKEAQRFRDCMPAPMRGESMQSVTLEADTKVTFDLLRCDPVDSEFCHLDGKHAEPWSPTTALPCECTMIRAVVENREYWLLVTSGLRLSHTRIESVELAGEPFLWFQTSWLRGPDDLSQMGPEALLIGLHKGIPAIYLHFDLYSSVYSEESEVCGVSSACSVEAHDLDGDKVAEIVISSENGRCVALKKLDYTKEQYRDAFYGPEYQPAEPRVFNKEFRDWKQIGVWAGDVYGLEDPGRIMALMTPESPYPPSTIPELRAGCVSKEEE